MNKICASTFARQEKNEKAKLVTIEVGTRGGINATSDLQELFEG